MVRKIKPKKQKPLRAKFLEKVQLPPEIEHVKIENPDGTTTHLFKPRQED